jgi:lipopolysaccharide/colanic/teichoic acid biosynthesis glycosyltransferase
VYDAVKRAVDVVAATLALVLLSPVLLVVAVFVRLRLGSPVVFRQRRPGRDGRLFTLYKFRTMSEAAPGVTDVQALASDAVRLTPLGRTLRRTSLDELPQLVNVVRGDMSLVGPRPLLPEYLDRYNERQARRHEVRPGITGWAQVHGRNAVSWNERLEMDVWYVDHRSLALDARIVLRSISALVSQRGVSAPGTETMPPFPGASGDDPHQGARR